MWEDYRINGADFSAGDNVEKPEMREQQLRKEAETFGLWNPEATARKLGFGVEDTVEEDEEDDWLAEVIRNVGESVGFCQLGARGFGSVKKWTDAAFLENDPTYHVTSKSGNFPRDWLRWQENCLKLGGIHVW
jgi:hypothetical protein